MNKLALFLVFILLSSMILSGCTEDGGGGDKTVTVTDMVGREVEIPKDIDEIVGIEAGALRLLVYMQAEDMVVGVEDFEKNDDLRPYIMAHPELQGKTSIGPQHGGDAELITAAQPDVIFWTYAEEGEADDLQKKTNIPVIVLRYGDIDNNRDTFYEALELIGEVLGKDERADSIIGFFDDTIEDLNNRTKDISPEDKPPCYVGGIGYRGAHGLSSTEPDYAPFQFMNADNVAGGLETEHAFVDPEEIIEWDPEILFVDEGGFNLVMDDLNDSVYNEIEAVENGDVYAVLPYNYYTANYGTIMANSYYIGGILYPEKFSDVNTEEKADEIYEFLVGEKVYDQMESSFGGYKKIG
ncbi:MAG: iron ABC transporter substrate-binding protein [Thermoplasmata archaeon]